MKKNNYIPILSTCVIMMLTMPTAEALKCGKRLVFEGDRKHKVRTLCGEPESVEKYQKFDISSIELSNTAGADTIKRKLEEIEPRYIEEWTYEFGPNRLDRLLRFENGVLTSIIILGF